MLKAISLFAGVGGIDKGFENAGIKTIWANEIDVKAATTYKENFHSKLIVDDIKNIAVEKIPDNFQVLLAGFPCQAFSLAGYRKGFKDERGTLFFEVLRIIESKNPQVVFLENVKNLVGHDDGNTFSVILDALKDNGYKVKYRVLNGCEYGNIPQNRERIYIVAFLDHKIAQKFEFPDPVKLTTALNDIINYEKKQEDKYYYTEENCLFYDKLKESINEESVIYQWRRKYVRRNMSQVCPTLTANMGTGGHNVPLIYTKFGIRKLTPKECFGLQGYPKEFKFPTNMSNTALYKQAGNSVVVSVISRIAENIKNAIVE